MTRNNQEQTPTRTRWLMPALAFFLIAGLVGALCLSLRETNAEQAKRFLAEARKMHRAGDYVKSGELAQSALEQDPTLSEAALVAAQSAAARRQFQAAVDYAGQIQDGPPSTRIAALLLIAELNYQKLLKLSAAEDAYRSVLALDPDNIQANTELAELLGVCGRGREAVPYVLRMVRLGQPSDQLILIARESGAVNNLQKLETALTAWPDDADVLVGLAWHADSDGRNKEATQLLRTALAHHPDHVAAYVALGRQLLTQALFSDLAEWATDTPSGALDFGETWFLRGRLAEYQGDAKAAIRCYWESIMRAPESKESSFRLSKLLLAGHSPGMAEPFVAQIRRIDDLRTVLNQAFSSASTDAKALELVKVLAESGRLWEAYGWSLLIKRRGGGSPELLQWLGTLQQQIETLPLQRTTDAANPAMQVDLSAYPLPEFQQTPLSPTVDPRLPSAAIAFRNEAASAGLVFRYFNGSSEQPTRRMFEFTGGGIGVLDYDLDGYPDACFTQGCPWPPTAAGGEYDDQLFRNQSGQRFENVTQLAGLKAGGFGQGISVGDYDSDGFADLYLARIGGNQLWRNNGDGTFSDVTLETGLLDDSWTTSCLMADLNGDGHPDIYDVNYLQGEKVFDRVCRHANGSPALCKPFDFEGQTDRLWLSSGDGRFSDATAESLSTAPDGKGLGVLAWDAHGSGRLSLLVANDTTPNFFFTPQSSSRNGFHLEEQGLLSGLAFNGEGKAEGCMGIALGDVDGNGILDIHVTNFLAESNTLWLAESPGLYDDRTQQAGLREPTLNMLGFGTQFLDADLDGRLELFVANGHVDDLRAFGKPHAMPPQLFQWDGTRFHESHPEHLGPYFQKNWLGRSVVRLDWNRDGLYDLLVGHLYEDSALLTNITQNPGRYLSLKLIGKTSCRDPIGTTVQLRIGQRTWVQQLTAGDGYQASNSRELIFGIGQAERVDELIVRWPSGLRQPFAQVETDIHWGLIEGNQLWSIP